MTARRQIFVEIAPGELMDKITILQIKQERILDPEKLQNIARELAALERASQESIGESDELTQLCGELKQVNESLWVIEDDIRECERQRDFGEKFVELARSVYHQNDRRAELKRKINVLLGAEFLEEKSYAKY